MTDPVLLRERCSQAHVSDPHNKGPNLWQEQRSEAMVRHLSDLKRTNLDGRAS